MKKPLLLATIVAGAFSALSPAMAQIQLEETPAPVASTDTIIAVPAPASETDWMQYKDAYVGEQNDLSNPNKTVEEVLTLAQGIATEALTFSPAKFNEEIAGIKPKFIPQAWSQYSAYLHGSKIVDMVSKQNYTLSTIIDGSPRMLDQMPAGGNYHWLVEAPLLMSFTGADGKTGTSKFKLVMQLGRIQADLDAYGLAVENWRIEQLK